MMIEDQLEEIKGVVLAIHRKVANIEMQMRNPCDKCYYKNTHPKPAIPRTKDHTWVSPDISWGVPVESPETSNKFQDEYEPDFQPNVPLDPPPEHRIKTNSVIERVYGSSYQAPKPRNVVRKEE